MPRGYVYDCPNKYILSGLLNQIKAQKINYSIYDEYIVVEKQLRGNFSRTALLTKTVIKNGIEERIPETVKIRYWKNNEIKYKYERISVLRRYKFSFSCNCKNFYLNTGTNKYKFKRINEIFEEYFRKKKKAYFEKKWEELPIDGDIIDTGRNAFDKLYNFNFEMFYNNIYKDLTENQQMIISFFMLNIMEVHAAKLMKVSQPYISLELDRIAEKIKKRMNIDNIILDVE